MTDRITGTVKWFDASKGYGFIARSDGRGDVFVHISDVQNSGLGDLQEGQRVSFDLERTDKGWNAVKLALGGGAPSRPALATDFPADYLEGGYFETVEGKRRVKPVVVDKWAETVARVLGRGDMKAHQLRRFFNKARAIESKLDSEPFAAVVTDIHTFKRDAAYAVSRKVAPKEFKEFIDRNVELAVQDLDSFRKGFIEHFQSIMAYFAYYFRDK